MNSRRIVSGVLVVMLMGNAGCTIFGIGVKARMPKSVPPDTPIFLRSDAESLRGGKLENVVTSTDTTFESVPLDTQLIRRVAGKASAAVVSIYTETSQPYQFQFFPIPLPGTAIPFSLPGRSLGSAFFVHPSGFLLTNDHVIVNAKEIVGRLLDGKSYALKVVARDPVLDLALLKVVRPDRRFPVVPMGDSEEIGVGDWVIAVGNPLGLGHTVTHGIISRTGRNLHDEDPPEKGRQIEFLQTDTPINPGSSGGPLITLTGAWVGVNTAILLGTQGISLSVPSSQVKGFLESVLAGDGNSE